MLELKQIIKDYQAGDSTVHALKSVSIRFRPHEFVAVLGPSGCGKTTLLNIIGGLDQYTSGDLVIDGRSTKDFSARDWDTYPSLALKVYKCKVLERFRNIEKAPSRNHFQDGAFLLWIRANTSRRSRR